jgi:alpha-beta hydrolase superfamily lysophospholipase
MHLSRAGVVAVDHAGARIRTMPPTTWPEDRELKAGFGYKTLTFRSDYDGPVTATLVRNEPVLTGTGKPAILYIHGFIDYFFQKHVACRFKDEGHNFYGLDLRKYGRSLNGAKHPNICLAFEEYFEEITKALEIIAHEGDTSVVLMAHSTGALPGALYAKSGSERAMITRIIFNSPFLKIPRAGAGVLALFGKPWPFCDTDNRINKWYAISLHKDCKGTWDFNRHFKPIKGFDAYYGWIRAVVRAQNRIEDGHVRLDQPVLVMHSDKSADDKEWSEKLHRADLVLNVEDIKKLAPKFGPGVVMKEIPDGKHDLTLSLDTPRKACLDAMVEWAGKT